MTSNPGSEPTAGELRIGTEEISEILRAFEASDWTGMHLRIGGVTVSVGKDAPPPEPRPTASAAAADTPSAPAAAAVTAPSAPQPAAPAASPAADEVVDETGLVAVTAPTVGTFWVAPAPGSPPFVEVGSRVAAGDQLAIVEVMKLMNPVITEIGGEVVAVRARNADLVEFGQTLFLIRPDD